MAKIEYDIKDILPKVKVKYSGNIPDPLKVSTRKPMGTSELFLPEQKDIITKVENVEAIKEDYARYRSIHSQMPFYIRSEGEWIPLPIEPLVSVSGQNNIVRRTVAKSDSKGTIKEFWSQDDYSVSIKGVLWAADENIYPREQVSRIRDIFDKRKSIEVYQEILFIFEIKSLAIQSINWPHTKGMNNQNYEISAYSDMDHQLLIEVQERE